MASDADLRSGRNNCSAESPRNTILIMAKKAPTRVTMPAVNAEPTSRGIEAALTKASGYFYFEGDATADWLDRTVPISKSVIAL
jgi:hypothetical protein